MTLSKYKEKRNFKESPEPTGGEPDSTKHCFVIQKHHASRLHYDFRLEMEGVLKSWAVPKGPSTDPDIKRLAMMVEDHPFDYKNFEGIIPSGYGAGTVIVWDNGYYELADAEGKDKKTQDKELIKGIAKGKLHVVLHGKKLKGEYALIKTHGKAENAWLLFKVKDEFVSKEDITLNDKSVLSQKTLEQLKNKTKIVKDDIQAKTTSTKSKIPLKVMPMLATPVDKPFDKEGWQYEIKWDGYRVIAFCNKGKVELKSRNDKSFSEKFYPIQKAVEDWKINAVVDGEVVVLDKEGKSNFGALQNWKTEVDGPLCFYVFDLLWMNGENMMQLPLSDRRSILKQIIPKNDSIRLSENFEVNGIELFETAKKMGLEGIMAKRSDSNYNAGLRSKDWLKVKANKTQEMVIGGYTLNADSIKSFSSLLLGEYENGNLIYTGKVGTGFSDKQQKELLKQFKPLLTKTSPFSEQPNVNKLSRFNPISLKAEAIWMKPKLVCEVSFTEMTKDGVMRHPSFECMRIDKKAKDVTKEKEIEADEIVESTPQKKQKPNKTKESITFLNESEVKVVRAVNGHEIKFNNLDKVYWPKEKITKRDMLNYYSKVAPYILPYLKNRPQSMNRHPDGINGESFYFKDVTGTAPDWIETFEYKSESDGKTKNYLVAKDEASLLYMATLGCIEMNPWHSRVENEDYPDWCIIDLDPAENTFNQVIEAANVTRQILESLGVKAYPKTSGSTGIHIYIPLGAKYTYEQSKEFARIIAILVQREIPEYTSLERIVKARKGKMYIDFLQNRPQATVAAPYALRPKPGATVSMPLEWDEVKKGLKMTDFTIHNALERIKSVGDIFKPVLGKGIDLELVIKTFNKE
jgi:bifunctional non-homologous end joining protein LigD